ncbi:MAG: rRNA maturation RNase YbeY [Bacteroidota bacterium]
MEVQLKFNSDFVNPYQLMANQQPSIQFHSQEIVFSLPDEEQVVSWLKSVIDEEGQILTHLNFIFCSDDYLLKVNQEYLNHDYYTDVITFPLSEDEIEGDIFISVDRVRENAIKIGVSEKNELFRVMVHGVLHLLGFGDKSEEEKVQMTNIENHYLKSAPTLTN